MSRTFKDKPARVRLRENMDRGLIDHDHRATPAREGVSRYPDHELSVTYYKRAQKEIREYRAYLDGLENIEYEEVETDGGYVRDWSNHFDLGRREPKTVRFNVYRAYSYPGRDGHCTADEYDENQPSWKQACTPRWTRDLNRWRRSGKNRYSRAQVRAGLEHARALARGDWLEDGYSDPVLEEQYGKKVWSWDD